MYDNKQISLALIITVPFSHGGRVGARDVKKYDSLKKKNKIKHTTFKGEHIDDSDRTFIRKKRQTVASAFRNHMDPNS